MNKNTYNRNNNRQHASPHIFHRNPIAWTCPYSILINKIFSNLFIFMKVSPSKISNMTNLTSKFMPQLRYYVLICNAMIFWAPIIYVNALDVTTRKVDHPLNANYLNLTVWQSSHALNVAHGLLLNHNCMDPPTNLLSYSGDY